MVSTTSLFQNGPIPRLVGRGGRADARGLAEPPRSADGDRVKAIGPVVDRIYRWTQARAALEAMQPQSRFGKIVLTF
jgi:hypothetical protein